MAIVISKHFRPDRFVLPASAIKAMHCFPWSEMTTGSLGIVSSTVAIMNGLHEHENVEIPKARVEKLVDGIRRRPRVCGLAVATVEAILQ